MNERVMVALDFPNAELALRCVEQLEGTSCYVKVGMQLYYSAGPSIVRTLKEKEFKVFVDLKVHDIPNTAKGAMESLGALGVDMVNVHAAGGKAMMVAAREGLEKGAQQTESKVPLLIGVTQLTSTSRETMNRELKINGTVEEAVSHYAQLAKEAGLDGVVASALEVPLIKKVCGAEFITVTPGIRPKGSAVGDQKRVTTPAEAFAMGADYIVIGRPITGADSPRMALEEIIGSVGQ